MDATITKKEPNNNITSRKRCRSSSKCTELCWHEQNIHINKEKFYLRTERNRGEEGGRGREKILKTVWFFMFLTCCSDTWSSFQVFWAWNRTKDSSLWFSKRFFASLLLGYSHVRRSLDVLVQRIVASNNTKSGEREKNHILFLFWVGRCSFEETK